ncbi:MAG TPA: hypothetical protein VNN12_06185 [Dehalococcoidia bacterium]|nr:hypothetical protein [Dehalococcoidia bacterium]
MRGVAMAKNAAIIVLVAAVPSAAQSARAQRVPDYDFDWLNRVKTCSGGDIAGPISALGGGIGSISVAGDLLANVTAAGQIDDITVTGDIGTVTSPVEITTTVDGGNILLVKAARIYADITTPNTANPRGDTKRIETTAGVFKGSLTTFAMQGTALGDPCITIAGDLDAELDVYTIKRPITITGAFPAGRTMRIEADLKTEAPITIGSSSGLGGQIIINAVNETWPWDGTVTVGSTTLSPQPYYDELSSALGGGAVGLAPFNFHAPDCVPEHDGTMSPPDDEAIDRHYGPVFIQGTDMPVIVERQRLHPPSSVWALVTSQHTASVSGTNPRDLIVQPNTGDFISNYKVPRHADLRTPQVLQRDGLARCRLLPVHLQRSHRYQRRRVPVRRRHRRLDRQAAGPQQRRPRGRGRPRRHPRCPGER